MKFKAISGISISAYTRFNLLSLDVVAGAMAGAVLAVKLTHTHPIPAYWFCLASAVWLVYSTDHLLDGLKTRHEASIQRHLFHYRNRSVLGALILVLGIAATIIAFVFLPVKLIIFGLILGFIIILYLLLSYLLRLKHSRYFFKEFIIAAVYVAGIWGGPVLLQQEPINIELLLLLSMNFLLALNNLFTLSYIDVENDMADQHSSFTVYFSNVITQKWIYSSTFLILVLAAIVMIFFPETNLYWACGIFMLMALLQLILFNLSKKTSKTLIYRHLGELVFLLPGIFLLLG